ncbi:MAG: hypothetical protein JRI91_14265 [Deltaproteobacteria bacterium]|nr:hypothetical protein [Deltaproteobacteria bacterium]
MTKKLLRIFSCFLSIFATLMVVGCFTIDEGIKSRTNEELLETNRKFSAVYDIFGELKVFEYYKSSILVRNFFIHVHLYAKVKSKSTSQDSSYRKYANLSWDLFLLDQMARAFGPGEDYESRGGPPAREDSINDYIGKKIQIRGIIFDPCSDGASFYLREENTKLKTTCLGFAFTGSQGYPELFGKTGGPFKFESKQTQN